MKVMKFGGTSVGSAAQIKKVASLITDGERNIVVLSAMAGTTNTLVEICDYLYKENVVAAKETINILRQKYDATIDELYSSEEMKNDVEGQIDEVFDLLHYLADYDFTSVDERQILAQGEIISTMLMHAYLREQGVDSVLLSTLEYVRTDEDGDPDIDFIEEKLNAMIAEASNANLFVTQGYICTNVNGEIDNLKRGGSDYTASLIGAAVDADEIQIWTDIDGMHSNDPRYVNSTHSVESLSFEEAAELAYFGAKVLHPTCILPAKLNNIPVRILNTMQPEAKGTLIYNFPPHKTVKAVAAKDNISVIKVYSSRMFQAYDFLSQVFEVFEQMKTPIDLIATSEVGVSVTIDNRTHLHEIVDRLMNLGKVTVDDDMVIICVVGDLGWHNTGIEAKVVNAVSDIPVRMISYGGSNYNISILVRRQDKVLALDRINNALFNSPEP